MDTIWRTAVWQQFAAAIDMLEDSIVACPEQVWGDRSRKPEYWYSVYHTLFYLDLYFSDSVEGFSPPAPFNLDELNPAGVLPPEVYPKELLLSYLKHGRHKCRTTLEAITTEKARQLCGFEWEADLTVAELVLDNLRHVQHHAGQLNLILRQTIHSAPRWVSKAKNEPVLGAPAILGSPK